MLGLDLFNPEWIDQMVAVTGSKPLVTVYQTGNSWDSAMKITAATVGNGHLTVGDWELRAWVKERKHDFGDIIVVYVTATSERSKAIQAIGFRLRCKKELTKLPPQHVDILLNRYPQYHQMTGNQVEIYGKIISTPERSRDQIQKAVDSGPGLNIKLFSAGIITREQMSTPVAAVRGICRAVLGYWAGAEICTEDECDDEYDNRFNR